MKTAAAQVQWMSFPDSASVQKALGDARVEVEKSGDRPPIPYQFTIQVMRHLYSELLPNVLTDDGGSAADPSNFDAASTAELRAIAYFSWHNERKLFVTRRVFPNYFDFFSLSYVDEGWGALGELLQDITEGKISEQRLFKKVSNVCANHRFLPFLKEAHRLDYKAAFVIPFFVGLDRAPATHFTKANLKGAMVFYLATPRLPDIADTTFQQRVANFSHAFSELVCINEKEIQTPVPRTQDEVKTNPWDYWHNARKHSDGLVFAELHIGNIEGDKEEVALEVQSALSGGDFVCLRDTSPTRKVSLCFWVTCLVDGKGPSEDSEDVFADKLQRSIAQAVANACATTGKLQLEVKIHGRYLH
jgi:hypothetical protein